MKLLKSVSLIVLSLFIVNSVNADTKETPKRKQEQKQTTQKSKKQQQNKKQQSKAAAAQTADNNLKLFNNTVGISLVSGQILNDNAPPVLQLVYAIENKDKKKSIASINWVGAFSYNNQVFFSQDIPVKFNVPLEPRKKIDITVTMPFDKISQEAQTVFLNQQQKIQTVYGAKNITFTNGSKIDVK